MSYNSSNNMDECQKHAERKMPHTKSTYCMVPLHEVLEQVKQMYRDRSQKGSYFWGEIID